MSSATVVRINGVTRPDARRAGAAIREQLGPSPNSASIIFDGAAPTAGQTLTIVDTRESPERVLFSGPILRVAETYGLRESVPYFDVEAVDPSFTANKRRPFGTWTATPAGTIALAIAAVYAPDCTTAGIVAGSPSLPPIDITFDGSEPFMTCLQRIATAINGRATISYANDLGLFLTDTGEAPDPIDATHRPLDDPPIAFTADLAQVRTRVYGKGYTGTLQNDVLAGEMILPIAADDGVLFNPAGGSAIAGTTAGGAQSEILTYTGVQLGGGGSLVGPGAAPSTAPSLTVTAGAGVGLGWYGYAVVDVTAAGQSLPGPVGTVQTGFQAAPTIIGTAFNYPFGAGNLAVGAVYSFAYTFRRIADGVETGPSPTTTITTSATGNVGIPLSGCQAAPSGFTRKWYHTAAGAGTLKADPSANESNNFNTEAGNFCADASLGAAAPSQPTYQQVTVTAIAIGNAPTTSREVYRTAVQASQAAALTAQLKLLTTIANNTSTGPYVDSTADGSLGANVPTSDISGIGFSGGQVNAGSTSLLTASAGPFASSGGWALTSGGQAVRYTGITGNTLTGIPASGPGALLTTVVYGSQILPAPALTGVDLGFSPDGIPVALAKGSTIAIWVQRDDAVAQTALAALEGGDGIREDTLFDGRLSEAELIARCDARLAQFSLVSISVTYATLDVKTRCGASVPINLSAGFYDPAFYDAAFYDAWTYGVVASFTIQDVTTTFIGAAAVPRFAVQASSVAFTLQDLLRLAQIG